MVKLSHPPSVVPSSFKSQSTVGSNLPSIEWRNSLPLLAGNMISLREVRVDDAPALCAALSTEQVSRFVSPAPSTIEAFEAFILRAQRQREGGECVCFAVVPNGSDMAIGLFQVRALEPDFGAAEWGFTIASEFWGTGAFVAAARLIINFSFDVLGVHRLEARASVRNGRGNGALRKLGAVQEGLLRRAFLKNGEYHDQMLWTILREEWVDAAIMQSGRVILH